MRVVLKVVVILLVYIVEVMVLGFSGLLDCVFIGRCSIIFWDWVCVCLVKVWFCGVWGKMENVIDLGSVNVCLLVVW